MLYSQVELAAPEAVFRDVKSLNEQVYTSAAEEGEVVYLEDLIVDHRPNPEEAVFCNQLKRLVAKAFWQLTPSQKRIAAMYFIQGMDKVKIAKELDMSRSAVTQATQKIIEHLKKSVLSHTEYRAA